MATPRKKNPKKAGRKSKYETHVLPRLKEIAAWCRDGKTDKEIAATLDVYESTFNAYKQKHSELKESLMLNKEMADNEVVDSLFKRAKGYEYEEETIEYVNDIQKDKDGNIISSKPIIKSKKVTKKVLPPDTKAADIWLRNRQSEHWLEKQHIQHSGSIDYREQAQKLSTEEELDAEIAKLQAEKRNLK